MKARGRSFSTRSAAAVAVGALSVAVAAGAAQPDALAAYQIQTLVKASEKVGGLTVAPGTGDGLWVDGLNDQGQILFTGTRNVPSLSNFMAEYNNGALVPIAFPGQAGPGGTWPSVIGFVIPLNMNQHGSVAFGLIKLNAGTVSIFQWDADSRQLTPLGLPGTPAADGLTFTPASIRGQLSGTAINNSNEVAFGQTVKDAAGKGLGLGAFFLGRDGLTRVIALPGQALPGGGTVRTAEVVSLNDAGVVGFIAQLNPSGAFLPYLWENGTITAIDPNITGGGQIAGTNEVVYVNNHDASALVTAQPGGNGSIGVYRWSAGQLTPVLTAGQPLPGGGTFKDMDRLQQVPDNYYVVSNDLGQYAFCATLTEGRVTRHGAYVLNPDGTLALILKEGMTTALGTITQAATWPLNGIGRNRQGQVALSVRINNGLPEIVLLTPSTP